MLSMEKRDILKTYLFDQEFVDEKSASNFLGKAKYQQTTISEFIEQQYESAPYLKDAYSRWAYALMQNDEYAEALTLFEKDSALQRQTWWMKLRMAECLGCCGKLYAALKIIEFVYEETPEAKNGYSRLAKYLLDKGKIISQNAFRLVNKDIELDRMTSHFMPVAAGMLASDNIRTASELATKAYKENKDISNAYANIGNHLLLRRRFEDSLEWFVKDVTLGRITPDRRLRYAIALAELDYWDDAMQQVQKACSDSSVIVNGYSVLAEIAEAKQNLKLALELYAKDSRHNRIDPKFRIKYASILVILGDFNKAVKQVKAAYRSDETLRDCFLRLVDKTAAVSGRFDRLTLMQQEIKYGRCTASGEAFYRSCSAKKDMLAALILKAESRYSLPVGKQWEDLESAFLRKDEREREFNILSSIITLKPTRVVLDIFRSIILEERCFFRSDTDAPVVFDCGGGYGLASAYFKWLYPESRIYIYEPHPVLFGMLSVNIAKNGWENTLATNKALTSDNGQAVLMKNKAEPLESASSKAYYSAAGCSEASVVSTCVLSKSDIPDKIDFLKLSVNGLEFEVLSDLMGAVKPEAGMVTYRYDREGTYNSFSGIIKLFENNGFGYEVFDTGDNCSVWSKEVVFRGLRGRSDLENEPKELRLINPEFRYMASANPDVLDLLKMKHEEWEQVPFYIRVHVNEFYHLMTTLEISPKMILEWGSGFSTSIMVGLSDKWGVNTILTIDDHQAYQEEAIGYLPVVPDYLEVFTTNQIGDLYPWEDKGYNYATYPLTKGVKYDLIFVDGRRRNECLLVASQCLAKNGIVILHDAWRKRYEAGTALFEIVRKYDDYLIMKLKNN